MKKYALLIIVVALVIAILLYMMLHKPQKEKTIPTIPIVHAVPKFREPVIGYPSYVLI